MTITQLKYLLSVAEHRNFTQAAEHCFVTQPTLSMQIQKLEDELDLQIFDRTKKPIEITRVGAMILEQAKHIVDEASRISDIVDQQKGFIGGDFTIGVIPTVMPTLLPLFLKAFNNKYPKVNLIIKEENTATIIKNLHEGKLDAAIAATPLENDGLVERPLYYEPFVAYLNHNNSLLEKKELQAEDLDDQNILLLKDGHCFRDGILNICGGLKTTNSGFNIESGSFETLINLVDEGLGMTLLPYLNTRNLSDSKKLNIRSFKNPSPAREISLIYHKNELKLHISEALRDVISGVIRGEIAFNDVKIISPLKK